jgi:hypothetical protein
MENEKLFFVVNFRLSFFHFQSSIIKSINTMRIHSIIFLLLLGLLAAGCSPDAPQGFPKKLTKFTITVLNEGKPLEGVLLSMYPEEPGALYRITAPRTGTDGLAVAAASINNYTKSGAAPGSYKVLITYYPTVPAEAEAKQAQADGAGDGVLSALSAKIDAERTELGKLVPKEWRSPQTTPLKITVPEKGGSVTIDITDEKTFVQ